MKFCETFINVRFQNLRISSQIYLFVIKIDVYTYDLENIQTSQVLIDNGKGNLINELGS